MRRTVNFGLCLTVAGFVPLGDGPGMLNEDKVVSKSVRPSAHLSRVHEHAVIN